MGSCLLNAYHGLGVAFGPGVRKQPASRPPSAHERAALPRHRPSGTRGSAGGSLHGDSCSVCSAPQNDGLSLGCWDFVFPSLPSAINITSGFEIKGDTLADESTARCWLLECTTNDLIQSTRNRRAPGPTPRAVDTR